ncbi:EscU/YscU/HrcU family type III secretion system export apparatus switch protein [Cupriavidus basilensis]|uniref:EscU/YscU/HrcU family type III secretion system export apparatus switch protein n=1 Tax=Cupriavidus basilensis TaxID=68895 RepID=A0ABT6AW36_9BURK|nr:EscU/YscU/HrcU family type III secretion system export apparatus switch protein [Cupriavidus basilensis]MDF3836840.1 EscU/YscU/HrcU family type III secretion system export apparatus switch protein [Cupriavidus basilensis]
MAEQEQARSENATPYKLEQARKKGTVVRSQDVGLVVAVLTAGGWLWAKGDAAALAVAMACSKAFAALPTLAGAPAATVEVMFRLVRDIALAVAPMIGVVAAAVLAAGLLQTRFLFAPAALKPDMTRINPMEGFKRLFSMQVLIEATKACLKLVVYGAVLYLCIREIPVVAAQLPADGRSVAGALFRHGLRVIAWFGAAALVFMVLDQVLVRWQFARRMQMSRREVKEEVRHREGDPRIKQRRKHLQLEMLGRARSLRNVRGADVLIANPTHVAVCLQYQPASMAAPKIVTKGTGEFAQRIKRLALVYGVPVVENRQLARELHAQGRLEEEIPAGLYTSVAAVYRRLRAREDKGD